MIKLDQTRICSGALHLHTDESSTIPPFKLRWLGVCSGHLCFRNRSEKCQQMLAAQSNHVKCNPWFNSLRKELEECTKRIKKPFCRWRPSFFFLSAPFTTAELVQVPVTTGASSRNTMMMFSPASSQQAPLVEEPKGYIERFSTWVQSDQPLGWRVGKLSAACWGLPKWIAIEGLCQSSAFPCGKLQILLQLAQLQWLSIKKKHTKDRFFFFFFWARASRCRSVA